MSGKDGGVAEIGTKRKADELNEGGGNGVYTVDEFVSWLGEQIEERRCGSIDADMKAKILANVREHGMDAAKLQAMGDDVITSTLGVIVLGQKRKIIKCIRDLIAAQGCGPIVITDTPMHARVDGTSGAAQPSAINLTFDKDKDIVEIPYSPSKSRNAGGSGGHAVGGMVVQTRKVLSTDLPQEVKDKMLAEEFCVNEGLWAAQKLLKTLKGTEHSRWAIPAVKQSMIDELEILATRMRMPGCTVVTVGDTGAGKSTLLNALLGETHVLPTNGMRACTAAIIELAWNAREDGPDYYGEVEFVTREEWEKEFDSLLDDLTQQDGRAILNLDPEAHNYTSWCKMFAVFGTAYTKSREKIGDRYQNLTIRDLKKKLMGCTRVTQWCGKKMEVMDSNAGSFRRKLEKFMDSSNEVYEGQFWPIVKRVRMMGRKWNILKTGCTLVDAPGVRDDNNARDKVVKEYLKEADSVWIVANIKRAVNDKTAKNMLGESFRRQLLMDGQYGQVVFIATQSDVLLPSEIKQNLHLDPDSTAEDCGRRRNEYTKKRIQNDYYAGIEEMSRNAKNVVGPEEMRERYSLPVFCVSAVDYQILAGVRNLDGDPKIWSDVEGTEIPKLQEFLHQSVQKKRFHNTNASIQALVNFCDNLEAFLDDRDVIAELDKKKQAQARALKAFDEGTLDLDKKVEEVLKGLQSGMETSCGTEITQQLRKGAAEASDKCLSVATGWHSLHWATYKATVRRHGVFRINMNEQLGEDIFRSVSTVWEKAFVSEMRNDLVEASNKLQQLFKEAHDKVCSGMEAEGGGITAQRLAMLRAPQERTVQTKLGRAVDEAKQIVSEKQKDLSRQIVPNIQNEMMPGYDRGAAEAGTGSHARRKDIIERHLSAKKKTMFEHAIHPVIDQLPNIKRDVVNKIRSAATEGIKSMRISYSSLWEDAASDQEAQAAKIATLNTLNDAGYLNTARVAFRKLRVAHGLEAAIVEDDEIKDITEEKKLPEARINLDSDDEDYNPNPEVDEEAANSIAEVKAKMQQQLGNTGVHGDSGDVSGVAVKPEPNM